jgi:trimeric autotransporter adhesin
MSEMRRPWRRLFLCALMLLIQDGLAQTVPMTTVQDTVYRADGSPAQGSLLISWPEFTTASGQAIAAGMTNVSLGTRGALSVALAPSANATPANTVYTVVYQLNDPL